MTKAMLELEMPRNCKNCPLKYYLDYSERNYPWEDYVCTIIGKGIADKGRRSDCPLKPVEDVEALRKAREAIQRAKENFEPYGEYEYDVRYDLEEVLAEINRVIGDKEDV